MEIEEKYHKIRNITIHYLVAGTGPPVLLVHGLGGSVNFWKPNIEPLSEFYRAFALDLPGHGLSDKSDFPFSPDYVTELIASLLDSEGVQSASVIGRSMGGLISIAFALAYSQRVDKLVIVDSGGLGTDLHWLLRLLTVPLLGEIMATPTRIGTKILFRKLFYDPRFAESELAEIIYQERKTHGFKKALLAATRAGVDLHGQRKSIIMLGRISNIKSPTMIIWGEQDRIIPVAHAHAAHKLIHGSSLHIFSHCGHCPQIEKADDFNRLVLHFLRS